MMRFNLLLVTKDSQASDQVFRSLSKVFRDNFIFEVPTLSEAESILRKLAIDLALIDLDTEPADLIRLNEKFPRLMIMGISSYQSMQSRIDPLKHQMLHKQTLLSELPEEFKAMKKERMDKSNQSNSRKSKPSTSEEFADFSSLSEVR